MSDVTSIAAFTFPTDLATCPFDDADWEEITLDHQGVHVHILYVCQTTIDIPNIGTRTENQGGPCVLNEVKIARASEGELRTQLHDAQSQLTTTKSSLAAAQEKIAELEQEVGTLEHPLAVRGTITVHPIP